MGPTVKSRLEILIRPNHFSRCIRNSGSMTAASRPDLGAVVPDPSVRQRRELAGLAHELVQELREKRQLVYLGSDEP